MLSSTYPLSFHGNRVSRSFESRPGGWCIDIRGDPLHTAHTGDDFLGSALANVIAHREVSTTANQGRLSAAACIRNRVL